MFQQSLKLLSSLCFLLRDIRKLQTINAFKKLVWDKATRRSAQLNRRRIPLTEKWNWTLAQPALKEETSAEEGAYGRHGWVLLFKFTQTCGRLLGHKRYENLVTWATFPWPRSGKAIRYLIPYSWYHLKGGRGFFSHSLLKFGISESSRKVRTCTVTEWTLRRQLGSPLSLCFSSSCVFQVVRIYIFCSELIWYIRKNLTVSFIVPHRTFVYFDLRAEKNSRKYASPNSINPSGDRVRKEDDFYQLWSDLRPKQKQLNG